MQETFALMCLLYATASGVPVTQSPKQAAPSTVNQKPLRTDLMEPGKQAFLPYGYFQFFPALSGSQQAPAFGMPVLIPAPLPQLPAGTAQPVQTAQLSQPGQNIPPTLYVFQQVPQEGVGSGSSEEPQGGRGRGRLEVYVPNFGAAPPTLPGSLPNGLGDSPAMSILPEGQDGGPPSSAVLSAYGVLPVTSVLPFSGVHPVSGLLPVSSILPASVHTVPGVPPTDLDNRQATDIPMVHSHARPAKSSTNPALAKSGVPPIRVAPPTRVAPPIRVAPPTEPALPDIPMPRPSPAP